MSKFFTHNISKNQIFFNIKVNASSKQNSIQKVVEINNKKYLKVSVIEKPQKGKANDEIIELLSDRLKIPKSSFTISSGLKNNLKTLIISNLNLNQLDEVLKLLESLGR